MQRATRVLSLGAMAAVFGAGLVAAAPEAPKPAAVRMAVEKALPILQKTQAEYIRQRECFSCHHQAVPALAVSIAREHGFQIDEKQLEAQVAHTEKFLRSATEAYKQGKGQGGGVTTAGYGLWTLEMGGRKPDEGTAAVAGFLLQRDQNQEFWRSSSNRPPSEMSAFTDTYLALRALKAYGAEENR